MGKQDIVTRIIADAQAEAEEIVRAAEERAKGIVGAAKERAAQDLTETKQEVDERSRRVLEGKAAAARLESAKILLAEKRRVMDEIYAQALKRLLSLDERDSIKLIGELLEEYAEEGDTILLAKNFKYVLGVEKLPVIKSRHLTLSKERVEISGGCFLLGQKSDKDLSYSSLLNADKEEHQAEIAFKLFNS